MGRWSAKRKSPAQNAVRTSANTTSSRSRASADTRPKELVVFAVAMTALCIGLFRYALGLPIPVLVVPGVVNL